MKLLMICGSLQPGRDGVGDYMRLIAAGLQSKGIKVLLISIYDRDPKIHHIHEESQPVNGNKVECIRLSRGIPDWKMRRKKIADILDQFEPDHINLQFVPYSFHEKGIPFSLLKLVSDIKQICSGSKFSIMFHELWLGIDQESSFRHKAIGLLQKRIIARMLKILQPDNVFTQTSIYAALLTKFVPRVDKVLLFGNIRPISIEGIQRKDLRIAVFGSIQKDSRIESFIKELTLLDRFSEVEIVFLGRNGEIKDQWLNQMLSVGLKVIDFGEQSEKEISKTLFTCSYGISSTPFLQIEKSGTVAAMLEHGLKVYCLGRPWSPKGDRTRKLDIEVTDYRSGLLKSALYHDVVVRKDLLQDAVRKYYSIIKRGFQYGGIKLI